MNRLKEVLKKCANDLQVMYYAFQDMWILSFEKESQTHFADPTVVFFCIKNLKAFDDFSYDCCFEKHLQGKIKQNCVQILQKYIKMG